MRRLDLPRRRALPSRWAVFVLVACIVASLFIGLGAKAQNRTPPTPSKSESSATIEDDPTLIPDAGESADNNVTFPVDI
jgi:hypothetical protein